MEKVEINGEITFSDTLNDIDLSNIIKLSKKYGVYIKFNNNSILFLPKVYESVIKKIIKFIHSLLYYMFSYNSIRHIGNKKIQKKDMSVRGIINYKNAFICIVNNWYANIQIYKIESKIGEDWIDFGNKLTDEVLRIMTNMEPNNIIERVMLYKEKGIKTFNIHFDKVIDSIEKIPCI